MEHGPDGGLSDGGWRLHGCVGGGGAEPLRPLWRRDGGNRTFAATGAAGGGGCQGEVNLGLDDIKLQLNYKSSMISLLLKMYFQSFLHW